MKLNVQALGYALAVLAGGFWFLAMSISLLFDVGKRTIDLLGGMHPFYHYTWVGMLTLTLEHLVIGYVLGTLFASFYNWFLKKQ